MAETPGDDRSNLFAALKGLLSALVEIGRKRLELLVNEAEEEKLRLIDLLVSAAGAVFLLSFGLVLLVVFLAVAFWEQRVLVLGISSGTALAVGALFALHLRSRLKQPAALFRASIKELGKDIEALRGKPADQR